MSKVLVVEDDECLAGLLKKVLIADQHDVDVVNDGLPAEEHLRSIDYDLIVLDWELPGATGIELCRGYRGRGGNAPVLFLTGKAAIDDKDLGFEVGADDYLTKPFNMREFQARTKALLRRSRAIIGDQLQVKDLLLDKKSHTVTKNGIPVQLLRREFSLLEFLMLNKGQVFSAEALMMKLWPTETDASENAVRQCVSRLRAKIDGDSKSGLIKTIAGVGYMLDA